MRGKLEGDAEGAIQRVGKTWSTQKGWERLEDIFNYPDKGTGQTLFKMAEQNKVLAGRGCQREYLVEFFWQKLFNWIL